MNNPLTQAELAFLLGSGIVRLNIPTRSVAPSIGRINRWLYVPLSGIEKSTFVRVPLFQSTPLFRTSPHGLVTVKPRRVVVLHRLLTRAFVSTVSIPIHTWHGTIRSRWRGRLYINKNPCKCASLTEVKYLNSSKGKFSNVICISCTNVDAKIQTSYVITNNSNA